MNRAAELAPEFALDPTAIAAAVEASLGSDRGAVELLEESVGLPPADFVEQLAVALRYRVADSAELNRAVPLFERLAFTECQSRNCIVLRLASGEDCLVLADPLDRDLAEWADLRFAGLERRIAHHADLGAYLGRFEDNVRALEALGTSDPQRTDGADDDGEVAVADKDGRTDFGALQDRMAEGKGRGVGYYLFDLLSLDGEDMRKRPLLERKQALAALLADQPRTGPLFYSDHVAGNGAAMLQHVCEMNLEGIISKRSDSPYRSDRSKAWLKSKCGFGQEFVIIGWRPSDVKGRPFSSILLGVREGDRLVYRGRVGSGFGERELHELWPELEKRKVKAPPAEDVPAEVVRRAHFVKPELVAEISFRGFTDEGYIRQGSYKGLRKDKTAAEVVGEAPEAAPERRFVRTMRSGPAKEAPVAKPPAVISVESTRNDKAIEIEGIRLTHPDKVIFPGQGITKRGLAEYYLTVKDRILAHVADRPLSLVRCPDGADGDCFFQKHASPGFPDAFKPIRIKEKEGSDLYLYIEDVRGLIACVQMGALELHIWGSHNDTLELPDRIVFDLDPDEEMDFSAVRGAATTVRDRLSALGLKTFPMVTGGKGVHVVAPLTPRHGWNDVKAFCEALARTMAAEEPKRFLAVATKAKRSGRIFIDYLRNGRGATAICPFSTRAKRGAPVAWPVSWAQLARLDSARPANVENVAGLLGKSRADPWASYFDVDQVLPLEQLGL